MKYFANRLKMLRKERNISQADLARILGVSRSSISSYENGSRKPDHDTLVGIASCFQVSVDYLLGYNTSHLDTSDFSSVLEEISDLLQSSSISSSKKEEIIVEVRDYFRWKLDQARQDHVKE